MLTDLTKEQRRLANFMSSLSEKCYTASWIENLEYVLWDTLANGGRKYGQGYISQKDIEQLIDLSKDCGNWIYFDDTTEETAIDISNWKQKFENDLLRNPSLING